MEPYNPITLKKRPQECPICGGEVGTILYGEPTCEAYEKRHEEKTIFGGCCRTEHDPAWQCYNCHTPIYQGEEERKSSPMAYATYIEEYEDTLPITSIVIHLAYDTKLDTYAAIGTVRMYYGDNIEDFTLRIGKDKIRQFFSPENLCLLKQAAEVTELPHILDGCHMTLHVEHNGDNITIKRNSANADIDNSLELFTPLIERLHSRGMREMYWGIEP